MEIEKLERIISDKTLEQWIYEAQNEQMGRKYLDKLLKERERRNKDE